MESKLNASSNIAFLILIYCISSGYSIASWSPEIVPAESGSYRAANEPIRLNFPADLPDEVYQNLALELDSIDISQVVAFEGDQLIFQPPQPLAFGVHELRLVEYLEDGSIEEIGLWTFEVRQSATFRQARLALNVQANGFHRFAEDYPDNVDEDEPNGFQGGIGLEFEGANETSSVYFGSNFLADHQSRNTARGEEFDLGEYLLQLNVSENAQFNVGHHNVNHTSLIYDGFYRRGASGVFDLPFLNSRFQAFSLRTGDLTGFRHGLGINDSDNRVTGGVWDYQPFSSEPEKLTISFSHLTGEGTQDGSNIGGFAESNAGNASSFSADSLLFNQSLRLRGEYSQSNYDFDGEGQGFSKESDNAYNYLISYSPQPSYEVENPFNWNVGAEKLVVGPDFRSLANTYLTNDKDMTRVFAGFAKGAWSADSSFAYEEDNLDDDFASTAITRHGYLSGRYDSYEPYTENSFWRFLGTPSYGLSYEYIDQGQKGDEPDLLNGGFLAKTDLTQHGIGLNANFNYNQAKWFNGWSTNVGWSELQDHSDVQSDSQTLNFGLGASLQFGRMSVRPGIQLNSTHEDDTKFDTNNYTYSLGLGGDIIKDKLYADLNFNLNDFEAKDDPINRTDFKNSNVYGSLVWKALTADGLLPGIDLRLTGSYNDIDDKVNALNDDDQYQVFINVDVNWAIQKPSIY